MNKRIVIIASVVGVIFLFAGYNLYNYFQTQAEIAAREERLAEERRLERERKRAERQAEEERREAERQAERERQAQEAAARAAELERERQEAAAAEEARREERERERQAQLAEARAERVAQVRAAVNYHGLTREFRERIAGMSPQFFRDNPDGFVEHTVDTSSQRFENPIFTDETPLFSILAMLADDPDAIQAGLDIGADLNTPNAMGATPVMFAASYNTPDMVAAIVEKGADLSPASYFEDHTALHLAARFNPHPDVITALVEGGADLEAKTSEGATPLLIAAQHNNNIEVVGRLVDLGADISVHNPSDGQRVGAIVEERGRGYGFERLHEELMEEVIGKFE